MNSIWCSEIIPCQEELICLLNWLGECGHAVYELWDYNDDTTENEEILRLFDACYVRKKEEIEAALVEME